MELYFTGHCRSARGRLQSDMISHQSGERCAMLVQRSQGMERDGKKGRVRGLLCAVILHHTQVLRMKSPWKNQPHQIPNLTSLRFPLYVTVSLFSLFPVSLYLCISFSLLLGIACKLPPSLSVSVMCSLALDCSHFLFSFSFLFLGSHL